MKVVGMAMALMFVSLVGRAQVNVHEYIISAQKSDSMHNYNDALRELDKAIELSKHTNDTAIVLHGKVSLENNDIKTAGRDVDEAIRHNVKNAQAYFLRAMIKAKTENYEGAIADFSKVIKYDSINAKAFYNRGLAHAYLDEIKQAVADFSTAIRLDPNYAHAWFNRGYWRDLMGETEGALSDLLTAKKLDPSNKEIYLELAVVYARNKKMKEACKELDNAVEAGHQISEELKNEFCK
ncbi:MAG: Tetratricopeptide 2 repeat-containing protein [Bacteroidetes bacterium]|jgi:tetratricopeptide (TPR) repeat protein|nr:Tetratricopeptide 2 repeat-containing protein [Bacteroidota bacterium]